MDDDLRRQLFDPTAARDLVLTRRPADRSAVQLVVSDAVWGEIVRLLRWATADTAGDDDLERGTWWRLAAGCADLLRRLPALSDEVEEPWTAVPEADMSPGESGPVRIQQVADRLAALLRSTDPTPLGTLASEVDALGAGAVSALAERTPWASPVLR
jgi:hypothetical protein